MADDPSHRKDNGPSWVLTIAVAVVSILAIVLTAMGVIKW